MQPYLDKATDKVYCEICDQELVNISHFTKTQMKALKQFKVKVPKTFSVKCVNCGVDDRPKLVNKDIVCPACNKEHSNLSEPFKIMLREKLRTTSQDV